MIGITLDFGRTPHVAFDQHRIGDTGERNGAREEQRPAGDEILRLSDVRHDGLGWLLRARSDAGQCKRRTHELQELAAALGIVPLGGLFRELPMEVLAKAGCVRQLAETAPIQSAARVGQTRSNGGSIHKKAVSYLWHVEQLVN